MKAKDILKPIGTYLKVVENKVGISENIWNL